MAQALRSQLSAAENKRTLFVIQAEDEYTSALDQKYAAVNLNDTTVRRKISTTVLNHPNMNETGRMPGFALLHIDMEVRLTQTSESGIAVTDATGKVVGIEFDEREPRDHGEAAEIPTRPVIILRYMPKAVYLELDTVEGTTPLEKPMIEPRCCSLHAASGFDAQCPNCHSCKNVVAITPFTMTPWALEVPFDENRIAKVKVRRKQLPLTCKNASTLHVLQGCTCDPGLIFHWKFPRRPSKDMVWLATYVAISRVRKLENLRSVGLTRNIKDIIEAGPPDSIPAVFAKYFGEKEKKTQKDADDFMKLFGWSD